MKLKVLIQNQTIKIDDHFWGTGEIKDWDNSAKDIHIHKSTKYKVDGKLQDVTIRLPINTDRNISLKSNKKNIEVPRKLHKEITKAFDNRKVRKDFVRDLIPILENFASNLSSIQKAEESLEKLSTHFNLEWTQGQITNYVDEALETVTQVYKDENNEKYYIEINRQRIEISNLDLKTRLKKNIF